MTDSNLKILCSSSPGHKQSRDLNPKTGILFVQLGTPDEATPQAVRRYLKEFLGDPRVVEMNRVVWWFILNFIILRTRPKKSAELYQRLFDAYGPILRTYSDSLTKKIQRELAQREASQNIVVRYGMRYGNPNVKVLLDELNHKHRCKQILVVPLFPQYSGTTTASVYDAVNEYMSKTRWSPTIRFLDPYYDHPKYIDSLAHIINEQLAKRDKAPEKLILSYHGIPVRYVQNGDPYHKMCFITSKLLKEKINFPSKNIIHTYQSRFGKEPWLQPYTDVTIESLAKDGIKDIMVACPAFSMDCLETLDEIAVENKHIFKENGGETLELISCLNDSDIWVRNLISILQENLKGWEKP